MPAVGGEANIPNWTLDGNISENGVTSTTYNLSESFDHVSILLLNYYDGDEAPMGTNRGVSLRLNGVTTSDYDYTDASDTRTTGATEIPLGPVAKVHEIQIDGRDYFGSVWGAVTHHSASTGETEGFDADVGDDVSSVTFFNTDDATFDIRAEIYGRMH